MGVAGVTARNARDRERKAQRKMSGIAVCAETDFPTNETLEGTEWGVVARFP